jgi:hypothetical protein
MDFIWPLASEVLGTNLCLTKVFLSQCCHKIPSIWIKNKYTNWDELMHLKEIVNTDNDLLLEIRLAY